MHFAFPAGIIEKNHPGGGTMELRYTVIDPTKNITLLVTTPVPRDVQPRVAAELL